MTKVTLEYLQTLILDYGVTRAPATAIWKVCREAFIINTSNNISFDLDWVWIEKTIGYSKLQVDLNG